MKMVHTVWWRANRLGRCDGDAGMLPRAYAVEPDAEAERERCRLADPGCFWWVRPVPVVPAIDLANAAGQTPAAHKETV